MKNKKGGIFVVLFILLIILVVGGIILYNYFINPEIQGQSNFCKENGGVYTYLRCYIPTNSDIYYNQYTVFKINGEYKLVNPRKLAGSSRR